MCFYHTVVGGHKFGLERESSMRQDMHSVAPREFNCTMVRDDLTSLLICISGMPCTILILSEVGPPGRTGGPLLPLQTQQY